MSKAVRVAAVLLAAGGLCTALVLTLMPDAGAPEGLDTRSDFDQISNPPNSAQDTRSDDGHVTPVAALPPADPAPCNVQCEEGLVALWSGADLSDQDYEDHRASATLLATYLRHDPAQLAALITLATTTADGNKRHLIRTIFHELDPVQQRALGKALLTSPDAALRREGANYLSADETLNDAVVSELVSLLATEFDVYTKVALIKALDKPNRFHGDSGILDALDQTLRSEIDAQLRGEALVLKSRLTPSPDEVFFDATSAVQSQDKKYALYGVRAMDTLLQDAAPGSHSLSWQHRAQARAILKTILDGDTHSVLSEEVSYVFARHF